ncbi:uncharacterized protein LOC122757051 isoform X2 [Drosophila mojavensis]|uniref:uncharacterized protein LOC122757051 isoform X2 n=1 Tax=Drosophila mojavensis TaxID=7230 RepID=UPI001CD09617|nr:uncharacterized protein LOC122757051 isoform X2 [Drosophila mojavensis]
MKTQPAHTLAAGTSVATAALKKQGVAQCAGAAQHLRDAGDKATKQHENGCWRRSRSDRLAERAKAGYKNKTHVSTNSVNIYAGQHGANGVQKLSHNRLMDNISCMGAAQS